jgi:peptidoglycan hydrolase-like protein with peptidoglycan-binding domain
MSNVRVVARTLAMLGLAPLGGIFLPTACGQAPESMSVGAVTHDLTLGSKGPEVQAVYDYLHTYGYFPNDQLQSQYPAWRPIVASEPTHQDVFDDSLQKAVAAFQRNVGLPATGTFDASTRDLASQPRCGVPDGIQRLDPTDKWASENTTQGWTQTVNWYVQNTDGDLPIATVTADIQNMLNQWHQWSGYTFANSSNNAEIIINFATLASNTNASTAAHSCLFLGHLCSDVTPGVPAPSYVTFNSSRTWFDNGSAMDLPTIAVHELGHALGLAHSSFPNAVMYPINNGSVLRNLSVDDIEGIVATNPVYTNVGAPPGLPVYRAAENNHVNGPSFWALAGGSASGDHQIWELNGSWAQHPGGAVRIAVNPSSNDNRPWVVNSSGQVFRWNWSIQNWDNIPACATDIGIGSDDSVWVIGCDSTAGGYHIYKYNGDASCAVSNCWTQSDGGATTISVGAKSPTDATIVPWVINNASQIFRRTSSDPNVSGAWEGLPGLPGNATGIAGGAGYSYAIDNQGSNAPTVFSWDEQAALNMGNPPAPSERGWTAVGLGAASPHPSSIAAGGLFPIMVAGQSIYTVN